MATYLRSKFIEGSLKNQKEILILDLKLILGFHQPMIQFRKEIKPESSQFNQISKVRTRDKNPQSKVQRKEISAQKLKALSR